MTNMKHYTYINNESSYQQIYKNGVFQGSVLATTLFNIYVNNVSLIDQNNILLYADDLALINYDTNLDTLINMVNKKLEIIYKWFYNKQLIINLNKTKYMLIKGKKKINTNNITIKIDNNTLEQVTTYKYLGAIVIVK
jgi:hypothetical protein